MTPRFLTRLRDCVAKWQTARYIAARRKANRLSASFQAAMPGTDRRARARREDEKEEEKKKMGGGVEGPGRPGLCEECGIYPADPPSRICLGCEAYREHQS